MNTRTFFLISIVPIFIALAAANATALYVAKSRELDHGLRSQATAAAVGAAEYVTARPDLRDRLTSASGRAALTLAIAQIEGLDSIYLLDPKGRCCRLLIGLAPGRLPTWPAGDGGWPRVGAIEARSNGEHTVTAMVLLPDGNRLGVDIDADRFLTETGALRREALTILVVGVLTGIVVASIVASWLSDDLRELRRLLAVRIESAGSTEFRFIETKDAADAIMLLYANLRSVASLRKRRILDEETSLDSTAVLRLEAACRAPETCTTLHACEVAIGSIGQIEPGDTFALIDRAEIAACILIRAHYKDAVLAIGAAALAKRTLERATTFEHLTEFIENMRAVLPIELLMLAWMPGSESSIALLEVREDGVLRRTGHLSGDETQIFSLDDRVTRHAASLDRLGWTSAADRLSASRNLAEGNALAVTLKLPRV